MHPYLIDLGFIKVPTYGFMIAMGYIFASNYIIRSSKQVNIDKKILMDLIFITVIGGFIGGKIFYLLTFFNYFGNSFSQKVLNMLSIDNIRSGFVFYGGFIGGTISLYLFSKKHKLDFLKIVDLFAPALSLGHFFGRLGCFFAGCCHGRTTQSIFGVKFTNPMCDVDPTLLNVPIHPTQLYEAFGNITIFFILSYIYRKKILNKDGSLFILYIFSYSILRFTIEFFRGDNRGAFYFGFSQAQMISLIMILISVYSYINYERRND